jgi:MFS family permease
MDGPCVSTDAEAMDAARDMPAAGHFPPLSRAIWPMLLLFLAANLYSIDKNIVGVLAEPIKHEFKVSDAQLGLLLGVAYSLLSAVLGLGLGWLIDHRTRRTLLAGAILLWSGATLACGLVTTFQGFFVARTLVGLGEAAVAPAAMSLIADLFAPARRGRALSAYFIGASIGSGLSSVIPGWVLKSGLRLYLPLLGPIEPWRSAFVLCGLAGPVVALLFLTVAEPRRHGLRPQAGDGRLALKFARLWSVRRLAGPLFAGFTLFYVALVGLTSWTAVFVTRRYGVPITGFSNVLGLMLLITGVGGYLSSGLLTDSRFGRGRAGRMRLLALLPLLGLPSAFATFAPAPVIAIMMLGAIGTAMPMINVAMNATMQDILPNDMRGFGYAALGLLTAVVSGSGGPWLIAAAGDASGNIGTAFLLVGLPFLLASSACFAIAWRAARVPERT